jgi:beta-1,4-mannosyl-glycoprotein beta-1,4-N-acetylglucosaminyltransferase
MIYDCFTFFNELDLLEIRFNILDQVVDYFVLVEASKTHTNKDKAFEYEEHKERFKAFHKKIIHIKVDDFPPYTGDPWVFENFQREAIARGLTRCKNEDYVLISDLDEIPSPEAIKQCKGDKRIFFFKQNFYNFFLNMRIVGEPFWNGTVMLSYSRLTTPERIRVCRLHFKKNHTICILKKYFYKLTFNKSKQKKWSIASNGQIKGSIEIENGGWHFSYLGGIEKIILKVKNMAHQEYNTEENTDPKTIMGKIENGTFYFRNYNAKLEAVSVDESFPLYVRDNLNKYKHLTVSID